MAHSTGVKSCDAGPDAPICWFCRKERHEECMVEIAVDGRSDGPHDCTFDAAMIHCSCRHR